MESKAAKTSKLKEWWDRYKYPELISTGTFLLFHLLFMDKGIDQLGYSYLITAVEYFSYYGVILFIAYAAWSSSLKRPSLITICSSLFKEFGPAALLDLLLIRPIAIWAMSALLHNSFISIVLGSFIADLVFYICTICCFEGWVRPSNSKDLLGKCYVGQ